MLSPRTLCFESSINCPLPSDVIIPPAGNIQHTLVRAGPSVSFTVDYTFQTNEYINFPNLPNNADILTDGSIEFQPLNPVFPLRGEQLSLTRGDVVTFNNFDTDFSRTICFESSINCPLPSDVIIPPGGGYEHELVRAGPSVPFTVDYTFQTDANIPFPMSANNDLPDVILLKPNDEYIFDVTSNDQTPLLNQQICVHQVSTVSANGVPIDEIPGGFFDCFSEIKYSPTTVGTDTMTYIATSIPQFDVFPSGFDAAKVTVRVMDYNFDKKSTPLGGSAVLTIDNPHAAGEETQQIHLYSENDNDNTLDVTLNEVLDSNDDGTGTFVSDNIFFFPGECLTSPPCPFPPAQTLKTLGADTIAAEYLGFERYIRITSIDVSPTGYHSEGSQPNFLDKIRFHESNIYYFNQGALLKVTDPAVGPVGTVDEVKITVAIGESGGRQTLTKELIAERENDPITGLPTAIFATDYITFSSIPSSNPNDIIIPPGAGNTLKATYVGLIGTTTSENSKITILETEIEYVKDKIQELSDDDSKKVKKELKKLDKKLKKLENKLEKTLEKIDKQKEKSQKRLKQIHFLNIKIDNINEKIQELTGDDSKKAKKELKKLDKKLDKLEKKLAKAKEKLPDTDLGDTDGDSTNEENMVFTTSTGGGFTAEATIVEDPIIFVPPDFVPDGQLRETCADHGGDEDGDGICNNWENLLYQDPEDGNSTFEGLRIIACSVYDSTNPNVDIDGDGVLDVDDLCIRNVYKLACDSNASYDSNAVLPLWHDPTGISVCPNPNIKDLYVELDYMENHKPSDIALANVVNAFVNSNALGANGAVIGIHPHFIVDEQIEHLIELSWESCPEPPIPGVLDCFFNIKSTNFGTVADRSGTIEEVQQRLTAKRQVTLYGLFAHNQFQTTSSGVAERPGNDFVVSLGSFENDVGSIDQQGATLLHEIGHNLGLQHGGLDGVNCKPTYRSVMNYLYQFDDDDGGPVDRPLDFLRYPWTSIQETRLTDNDNFVVTTEDDADTWEIVLGGWDSDGGPLTPRYVTTWQEPINDWNNNGQDDGRRQTYNVHYFGSPELDIADCHDTTPRTLSVYDDWTNLSFNIRTTAAFDSGLVTINQNDETPLVQGGLLDPATATIVNAGLDEILDTTETYSPQLAISDPFFSSWDVTIYYGDGNSDSYPSLEIGMTTILDHTYTANGVYTVQVDVINDHGGLASDTVDITVNTIP